MSITVRQLKEKLEEYDDDLDIFVPFAKYDAWYRELTMDDIEVAKLDSESQRDSWENRVDEFMIDFDIDCLDNMTEEQKEEYEEMKKEFEKEPNTLFLGLV